MKTIKLICLLIFMSLISGCDWLFPSDEYRPGFSLSLSFQDASGNDLLKGIAYTPESENNRSQGLIERKLYTLRIIDGSSLPSWARDVPLYYHEPSQSNSSYLTFPGAGGTNTTIEVTYLLICSDIFGNDAEYKIVVYCKKEKKGKQLPYYDCYRLTFDDEDIELSEANKEEGRVLATVILD